MTQTKTTTTLVALGLALALAAPASAQQTREEAHAAAQAEKATRLRPYEPDAAEVWLKRVGGLLTAPVGVYPFIGSVFPASGLAVGPGFRAVYGDSGSFDVHGAVSIRSYLAADASLALPKMASDRVALTLNASWLRAPEVDFFGVGPSSLEKSRSHFPYHSASAGASAVVRPVRFVTAGAGVDYLNLVTSDGDASIERRFPAFDTPGLGQDLTYVRSRGFAAFDWRQSAGYSISGGQYRADVARYGAREGAPFTFTRTDLEADQYVPILRGNSIIALRALTSFTGTDAGDDVPYFLLPDLGGSRMLRGYPHWRFRDRHRVLLTGEYRWTAGQFVEMALFVDGGKVVPERSALNLDDLNHSYGIALRLHAPSATLLRLELAQTRDAGLGVILAFGPVF